MAIEIASFPPVVMVVHQSVAQFLCDLQHHQFGWLKHVETLGNTGYSMINLFFQLVYWCRISQATTGSQ